MQPEVTHTKMKPAVKYKRNRKWAENEAGSEVKRSRKWKEKDPEVNDVTEPTPTLQNAGSDIGNTSMKASQSYIILEVT